MPSVKAKIKPELLVWARKTSGYSIEDVAKKMQTKPERIQAWENDQDEDAPTVKQLKNLANIYKRPFSLFYLPEPPEDFQPIRDFRRLPGEVAGVFSPNVLFAIRFARETREIGVELYEDLGEGLPSFDKKTSNKAASISEDPEEVGTFIRNFLGVSYRKQVSWKSDYYHPLREWRSRIEEMGILVSQFSKVEVTELRGFSIFHSKLPIIGINSKDSPPGRIFTLLHELTHLLLREGGICDTFEDYFRPPEEQAIEVFCNAVAAAALIPKEQFLNEPIVKGNPSGEVWANSTIMALARTYGTSREAILRRLLTLTLTSKEFYQKRRREMLAERKDSSSGFAYHYQRQLNAVGRSFARLVFQNYYQNNITLSEATKIFGVKVPDLQKIERAAF